MGYNNDWMWKNPLERFFMAILGFGIWYVFIMFILAILFSAISLCLGNNWVIAMFYEHSELCTFIVSVLLFVFSVSASATKEDYRKWKLSNEDKECLSRYRFERMTRKQKKLMAKSIRISCSLVFMRLSRMNLSEAIRDFTHSESSLNEQKSSNVNLLLRSIPNMEYTENGVTHTLSEWEILLTEKRIIALKDKIRTERHRIYKYRGKSDDARQADLLNISYLNYRKYNGYYNGLKKVVEKYGLNSNETKQSILLTIPRIGDLQEWKDFVRSKETLPESETTNRGAYASFKTNIIYNTTNICNIVITDNSFFVMAYFDNITFEERDTFLYNDVILYVYYYDFVSFVVFEFTRLRFAVPINLKDELVDFDNWVNSCDNEVTINLIEKTDGRVIASRKLQIKNMKRLKEQLKIQKPFDKIVMDTSIKNVATKSIDELVYNGFVLEKIKGERKEIETSLF